MPDGAEALALQCQTFILRDAACAAPQDEGREAPHAMTAMASRSHQSFTMFADTQGSARDTAPNQPHSIRAEIGVWRAPMRRRGPNREKFFCCKNCDSESVRHASGRSFECPGMLIAQRYQYREQQKTLQYCGFFYFFEMEIDVSR